jgi:DNA-directed RNA polymerase subunit M/transcription elongation factor TFIIS|uniref:DNA-directed RNA polymerase M/15kDa subunit domain-containing protein n=1 Tax=viral metagenome TaxID=1070528 RepID=A0A6C0J4Y0_9ZZZZ
MVVEFCEKCDNLMELLNNNDSTFLQCKSCGNINNNLNKIHDKNYIYRETSNNRDYNVTVNIKYDRTLPRIKTKKCNNKECNQKNNPEIVVFSKNSDLIKGYACTVCNTYWV